MVVQLLSHSCSGQPSAKLWALWQCTNKVKANIPTGTPKRQRESLGNTTGDPKRVRTDAEHPDQTTKRPLAALKPLGRRTRTDSGLAAAPTTGNFEQSIDLNPDPAMRTAVDARGVLEAALYLPTNAGELTTSQLANAILIFIATVSPEKIGATNAQHLRAIAILLHQHIPELHGAPGPHGSSGFYRPCGPCAHASSCAPGFFYQPCGPCSHAGHALHLR
jgi:hypothetical protein